MLTKIKKIKVKHFGHKREFSLESVYINSNNIISISNYENLQEFLITENSKLAGEDFSLIKIQEGAQVEDLIVLGSAEAVFSDIKKQQKGKDILNG